MKAVLRLIIVVLVIHATWRTAAAYWQHYQFKDGVKQTAQFAAGRSDEDIIRQVHEIAKAYEVPLDPDGITVRRVDSHTLIDASYTSGIEILPRYVYPWRFKVNVDAYTLTLKEAAP